VSRVARVGDKVRHPLYPELGVGLLQQCNYGGHPTYQTAQVEWPTGQVSRHCLTVLRVVQ